MNLRRVKIDIRLCTSIYACVVLLFDQKWYLLALPTVVLYLTPLALLLERYIQRPNCVLFNLVYSRLKRFCTLNLHKNLVVSDCPNLLYSSVYGK